MVVSNVAALVDPARESQSLAQRIIEMARVIEETADDLPPDCESSRLRACAQIIYESAEFVIANLETIEATIANACASNTGSAS